MLEHCERTKSAQKLVACIERSVPERPALVRTLMFMGFKAINYVKNPYLVPKNNKLLFMLYSIYKDQPLVAIEPWRECAEYVLRDFIANYRHHLIEFIVYFC